VSVNESDGNPKGGRRGAPEREAGPPNHHDDKVDSDQYVVHKELSLNAIRW